jgi:hypothetical protein
MVRDDCTRRLDEVEKAQPTIIFEVKDAAGGDVTAVTVTVDGKPWTDTLDGKALAVDPGRHVFAFSVAGRAPFERTFALAEGEKGRRERIVLESAVSPSAASVPAPSPAPSPSPGTAPAAAPPSPPASPSEPPPPEPPAGGHLALESPNPPPRVPATSADVGASQRTIGVVVAIAGVAALATGGVVGLLAKEQFNTAEGETGPSRVTDSGSAVGMGNDASIIVVSGAVAAVAGFVLWLAAPHKSAVTAGDMFLGARF